MASLKALLTALVICLACVASASAHAPGGGSLDPATGMSEHELRSFETQVLGPAHAAEHARERQAVRAAESAPAAATVTPPPVAPAVGGRWEQPFAIPQIGIHAVVLPTGKVMWFAFSTPADAATPDDLAQAWLWNPADGSFKRVDPPLRDGQPAEIWCGGQAFTADGRLLVVGGTLAHPTDTATWKGLDKAYTFNPWTEEWTEQPDMAHGRWYPTTTLMPDGRMAILSGLDENGSLDDARNHDVEVFTPASDPDGRGTMTKAGARGGPDGPPEGELYPHVFPMPSGRMLVAGPATEDSWFFNAPQAGGLPWDDVSDPSRTRLWGNAVIVPAGPAGSTKVMQVGGAGPEEGTSGDVATSTTELFDEANPASWTMGPSLKVSRAHANTVLLPDRSMVSVGGGEGFKPGNGGLYAVTGSEKQVDILDAAGSWRLGAAQQESRAYHSTAVLLPDGRVVSAGDDFHGPADQSHPNGEGTGKETDTAEIYDPPYLFNANGTLATRPTITSAPDRIAWNQAFDVGTSSDVVEASLVAPSATTHANDMSQRVIPLSVANATGGVRLTAPTSANVALPGYYMLFVLNSNGVPSVARWVKLGAGDPVAPGGGVDQGDPGAVAKKPASKVDSRGPEVRLASTVLRTRRGTLGGQVLDSSGVSRVDVALGARSRKPRGCRWWSQRAGRLASIAACSRPRWIHARLRRHGDAVAWLAMLRGRVPPGRYLVTVRAVDRKGNVTTRRIRLPGLR